MGKVFGLISTYHHIGPGTICHQTTIQYGQWVRNHARLEHLIDGQWIATIGGRVELRPLAGSDGKLGQMLARGSVLIYMYGSCQIIRGNGADRIIRGLVGLWIQLSTC